MISEMQLDRFTLDLLHVQANEDFSEDRPAERADVRILPEAFVSAENPQMHQLVLDIEFCSAADEAVLPYEIHVRGKGYFHFEEELDEDQIGQLLLFNGSAILLGLLRAQVAQATGLGPHGVFLLPTLNLREAFENASVDEEPEE